MNVIIRFELHESGLIICPLSSTFNKTKLKTHVASQLYKTPSKLSFTKRKSHKHKRRGQKRALTAQNW